MKFRNNIIIICLMLFALNGAYLTRAFDDDALPFESDRLHSNGEMSDVQSERSLISKMIERGKLLIKNLPKTALKFAGRANSLVPTPETIFRVSKHALIGLPQEIIAYAVNSVCMCFVVFQAKR